MDVSKEEHMEVRPKDVTNVTQKEYTTVPKGVYNRTTKRAYFNSVLFPSFTFSICAAYKHHVTASAGLYVMQSTYYNYGYHYIDD